MLTIEYGEKVDFTVGGTANDGGLVEGIVGRGELEEDFPFEDVRFVFVRIGVLEGDVGDGGAFDGDAFFRETFGGRHGAVRCCRLDYYF